MHFFFILCHLYALLEEFFCDTSLLLRHGPLENFNAFSTGPMIISLVLGKRKVTRSKINWNIKVITVHRCSSRPGTAECSAYAVLLLFRHTQIFGYSLPNNVLFLFPADLPSFEQSIGSHHLPYSIDVVSVLLVESFPSESHFPLSHDPLWNSRNIQKLHTLAEACQEFLMKIFSNRTKNFWFIHKLVSSFIFLAHIVELFEKRGVNKKHIKKNTLVAKSWDNRVLDSQDTMLSRNKIHWSIFRPQLIQSRYFWDRPRINCCWRP